MYREIVKSSELPFKKFQTEHFTYKEGKRYIRLIEEKK